MLEVEVGIDLGGGEIGVAQQLLHRPQIAGGLQHVGGEAVAQLVGMNVGIEGLLVAPAVEPLLYRAGRQSLPALGDEQRLPLVPRQQGPHLEPLLQPLHRHPAHGQHPLPRPLAGDPELALIELHVREVEPHQLGEAQAGGVHQLHDGAIPHRQRILLVGDVEQLVHLVHVEVFGQRPPLLGGHYAAGRVGREPPLAHLPVAEAAQGGDLGGERSGGEAGLVHPGHQAAHLARLEPGPVIDPQPDQLGGHGLQMGLIVAAGMRAELALDPQVFDKGRELPRQGGGQRVGDRKGGLSHEPARADASAADVPADPAARCRCGG
ncbi:hypothetical protein D3C72_922880 [compost metagenome]